MSQRNPLNERYQEENRSGKTRKSAASAKPSSTRSATVHTPPPKSKKQKQKEAREREREREQRYSVTVPDGKVFENTDEYKKLRRIWWVCIVGAIVFIAISFAMTQLQVAEALNVPCIVVGYVLVAAAFYIDFGKIRKMRKNYQYQVTQGKSKAARAAQKAARAEARAQQKEAERKEAEGEPAEKAEEEEGKAGGFFSRFRKKEQQASSEEEADSESAE